MMRPEDYGGYHEYYKEYYTNKGIKAYELEVGKLYIVDVTHIDNPHSFYVRPVGYRRRKLQEVALYAELSDASDVSFGDTVIYYSKDNDLCLRGEVLYFEEDVHRTCHIFAVDYGWIEAIPFYHIWKPRTFKNEPPLAKLCSIQNCVPVTDGWDMDVMYVMLRFLGRHDLVIRVREKTPDRIIVDLHNDCSKDLSTVLRYNGYAMAGNMIVDDFLEFRQLSFQSGFTMRVKFLNTQGGMFNVSPTDEHKWFIELQEKLTKYAKYQNSLPINNITENRPVALLSSIQKYERALIKQINKNQTVVVQLVDTGVKFSVNIGLLKSLPRKFMVPPIASILCALDPSIGSPLQMHELEEGVEYEMRIIIPGMNYETASIVQIGSVPPKPLNYI